MATWATPHIAKLLTGETIKFRVGGNSMSGRIENKQLVTVEPVTDPTSLMVGEIVLCKVRGRPHLHLIKAKRGKQFQIANNHGHVNGWTKTIFGKVVQVEA